MARIAFFAERLPPDPDPIAGFSFELMCNLADQQHDVRIFSTFLDDQPAPPVRPRVEILRPFRRWNWFEFLRIVPVLLEYRPEIIHVIQPRAETLQGLTNALSLLPGFVPLVGKPALVASFYDLRRESLRTHRLLLATSEAVTVLNRAQLDLVESFYDRMPRRRPLTALLPVFGGTDDALGEGPQPMDLVEDDNGGFESRRLPVPIASPGSEALGKFIASARKLIFVPGDVDAHRDPAVLFRALAGALAEDREAAVLFGGGWGRIKPLERQSLMASFDHGGLGARVFIAGPLTGAQEKACFAAAHVAFAASLPVESLHLTRVLRLALASSVPLVMSRAHADHDPLSWDERAFVAEEPSDWRNALSEALSSDESVRRIRSELPEFARNEVLDQPGNVMSRVYAEVLDRRGRAR